MDREEAMKMCVSGLAELLPEQVLARLPIDLNHLNAPLVWGLAELAANSEPEAVDLLLGGCSLADCINRVKSERARATIEEAMTLMSGDAIKTAFQYALCIAQLLKSP